MLGYTLIILLSRHQRLTRPIPCLTLFWFLLIFIDFGSRLERFLDPKSFLHEKGDHVGSIFDYFVSIVIDLESHLGSFWTQPPPNRVQDLTNCKNINNINLHANEAPALFPVGFQCAGVSPPAWLKQSPKRIPNCAQLYN